MDDPRYHTAQWRRFRARIIQTRGPHCTIPGCQSDMTAPGAIHVDHIIEVKDGGPFYDETNVQVVCKRHHFAKTLEVAASRPNYVSPFA